jgi:two-component system cell cycle response regulator DivK
MTLTVLYIDDNADNLSVTARALRLGGYASLLAPDGRSGLQAYEQHQPDLVLLDIGLPDISGLAVAKAILRQNPKVPIIALTANAMPADVQAIREAGCVDYIAKPMDVRRLLDKIDVQLGPVANSQANPAGE